MSTAWPVGLGIAAIALVVALRWRWIARLFRRQPSPPVVIPNQAFTPHDIEFWRLYERCRYNGIICNTRVVEAIRADNRANVWLLISTVGGGLAGAIKVVTHLNTDIVWEAATIISVVLAIVALWKKAPEIKYTVFESIGVFDALAVEIQQRTIVLRTRGTEDDIVAPYQSVYDQFSAELRKLGSDHVQYATTNERRLRKRLERTLRREGLTQP